MEKQGAVTFQGNPLTLVGEELAVGAKAPDFTVIDNDLQPVKLSDFKGQVVIISAVPSLDTPVCEIQTKKFNESASKVAGKIITISMDLPFAQKRFCSSFKIDGVKLLSDYKDREFQTAFGLRIKELGLVARSIFVIDKEGKIAYKELVKEITQEPNYEEAIKAAAKL